MQQVDIDPVTIQVRDEWIPMPDGVQLHARLWMPRRVPSTGVPVVLEYLPYRLDDWTSVRDSERHPYYAAHGYASVRVDIRGTGSSQGLFDDEYSPAELDDGVEVVQWLAAQPWSTGKVGMFGISWGGFNSLQIAERAPEALKAVVTVCSTDDRFDNDVHYIGGAVLGIDMSAWAGTMLAFASRPPRPEVVGPDWVELWRRRLQHQRPLAPVWMGHQERDEYWKRGSVCENYGGIQAAVLAVGGWSDPYRDTVLRLLENLDSPVKGILGPWPHQYPDRELAPGPMIGFLQETLRWWDQWLKDTDTGVLAEPDLRAWITDPEKPAPYIAERVGRWVGVDWDGRPATASWELGTDLVTVDSPWNTGQDAGRYFPFGNRADLPPDQRAEDGRSTCVDLPVTEAVDILGKANVTLRLASTTPRSHVIVRLCDVAPDGTSTLVTRGVLNLLKREGMDTVVDLVPGEPVEVTVDLDAVGYHFAEGHRIRVALSNHYWPWVWPHGTNGRLEVDLSRSRLDIPLLDPAAVPTGFEPPEHARPIHIRQPEQAVGGPARAERLISHDVAEGITRIVVDPGYGGTRKYPDGLTFLEDTEESYEIRQDGPASPRAVSRWRIEVIKQDWRAQVQTSADITCDAENFYLRHEVEATATEDGQQEQVFSQVFTDVVPRTSA